MHTYEVLCMLSFGKREIGIALAYCRRTVSFDKKTCVFCFGYHKLSVGYLTFNDEKRTFLALNSLRKDRRYLFFQLY